MLYQSDMGPEIIAPPGMGGIWGAADSEPGGERLWAWTPGRMPHNTVRAAPAEDEDQVPGRGSTSSNGRTLAPRPLPLRALPGHLLGAIPLFGCCCRRHTSPRHATPAKPGSTWRHDPTDGRTRSRAHARRRRRERFSHGLEPGPGWCPRRRETLRRGPPPARAVGGGGLGWGASLSRNRSIFSVPRHSWGSIR